MKIIIWVIEILFFWQFALGIYSYASDLTTTLNLASVGLASAPGNSHSQHVSMSDDARYLAFVSESSNLVSGDTNGLRDIFVYDSQSGSTTRVNVSTAGVEANAKSYNPVISGNGRYVAFVSLASNLVANDTNGCSDVFVRDLQSSTTIRVSVGVSAVEANNCSDEASLSDDGRYVGFRSAATNLIGSGDQNGLFDFFVRDIQSATTSRVSISTASAEGDGDVIQGKISGNGSYFVFTSEATNMVIGDTNGCMDVFYRNIGSNTTTLISQNSSSSIGNRASHSVDVSADGRYVVFTSRASNLISGDANAFQDIFLRDTTSGTIERINLKNGNEGEISFESGWPVVSNNGRYVLFVSNTIDLKPGDNNKVHDIYIRDRASSLTAAVSTTSGGVIGDAKSFLAAISGDSLSLAFSSIASNLVAGDTNASVDIFYRENPLEGQVVNVTVAGTITEEGGTQNAYVFERFGDTTNSLDVNYSVSGTATSGTDFTALSGTVTIPASQTTFTLQLDVLDEVIVESDETVVVTITSDINYTVGGFNSATTIIPNIDEFEVEIIVTDNQCYEDGLNNGIFRIERTSGGTMGDLTVNINSSGDALAGVDYVGLPSSVVLLDGVSFIDVSVVGIEDTIAEDDETIVLTVGAGTGYSVGGASFGTVTINDNDQFVVNVTTLDSVADESNVADTASFRINRENAANQSLNVSYSLKGTATNGVDYVTVNGTATIASGESSVDVLITPIADALIEGVETVILELLTGPTYTLGSHTESALIIKEDSTTPIVSIEATDSQASEDGTDTATIIVSRTGSTSAALNVMLSFGGSAINGTDYQSIASSISIGIGQSQATITVTGIQDLIAESSETVVLAINSATNYEIDIVKSRAQVLINDDDTPSVSIDVKQVSMFENGLQDAEVVFSRTGDLSTNLTVDYTVAGTATSGTDYQALSGSEVIPAGEELVTLKIKGVSDLSIEKTESVSLTLSTSANYSVSSKNSVKVLLIDTPYRLFGDILSTVPNADIESATITDDGKYVVFQSRASNLVAGDTNGKSDIFVVDTIARSIVRILTDLGFETNGDSFQPMISGDGNFVVFTTNATNFTDYDQNGRSDIILWERTSGLNTLVSRTSIGASGDGHSLKPYISNDGMYIVYESRSSNLVLVDTNNVKDIFLYNRITGLNTQVTDNSSNSGSGGASVSNDGKLVAFETFEGLVGNSDTVSDVFYKNLDSDLTYWASKSFVGTENNGDSKSAQISGDGSTLVFQSNSSLILNEDGNASIDVFSYSLADQLVKLVSISPDKTIGDKSSLRPKVNNSGSEIFFVSNAKNFSSDFNCTTSTFVNHISQRKLHKLSLSRLSRCGEPVSDTFVPGSGDHSVVSFIDSTYKNVIVTSSPVQK